MASERHKPQDTVTTVCVALQNIIHISPGLNNSIPSCWSGSLTDWGMLRFVMDRRTRRALRLLSPLGTHTCYHSIHLTQISPLINLMKTISINCGEFTKKGVGHCSVDSLIRLATLPPQVGTTRREEGEGEGAGAAGPEVKIIIIVQIIQM